MKQPQSLVSRFNDPFLTKWHLNSMRRLPSKKLVNGLSRMGFILRRPSLFPFISLDLDLAGKHSTHVRDGQLSFDQAKWL